LPLGMEVGLSPGDFGLDGDPASPSQKGGGGRGQSPPIFGPWLLWPDGWMDQDGTWHGCRPWSSPHCARWGHSSPPQKGTKHPPPQLSAHLYCGQTAGCIKMPLGTEVGLGLRNIVFDVDPAIPRKKGHTHPHPILAHVYCGQMAGWMKTPLGTEVDRGQGHMCIRRGPSSRERAQQPPSFRPMSIVATVAHLSIC